MILLLMLGQLLLSPPKADISWASRVLRDSATNTVSTVFVITYPAPVRKLERACLVLYDGDFTFPESDNYAEVSRECWVPTAVGDFKVVENFDVLHSQHNVMVSVVFINLQGERETHYAFQLGGDS